MLLNIILLVASYMFMEFIAWSNHKYVMHGFLWSWHKDHHVNDTKRPEEHFQEHKRFEKNDLFFLVYAVPAIALFLVGFHFSKTHLIFIASGISAYGLTYFLFHDIYYHKRLKIPFLHKLNNWYFRGIYEAHLGHHKPKSKSDFESYGLLVFPKKYIKKP